MEVSMRLIPTLLACILPLAAGASPLLPDQLMRSIKADPASYLQTVSGLIAAYGAQDGITEDQLGTGMALVRAKARALAIVPLIGADLDADGTVLREEILAAEAAVGAGARGKLDRTFLTADANADGMVTPEELSDYGAAAAMAAFSPARMAAVKVLIGFDADGDGKVTLTEVRAGLSGLVS
jgi:hypothetical protein